MGSFPKFQIAIVSIKLSAELNYNGSKISRKLMELFCCEVKAFTRRRVDGPDLKLSRDLKCLHNVQVQRNSVFTMLQVFDSAALMENVLAFLILMNKGVAM
jgi:hypothetical protein